MIVFKNFTVGSIVSFCYCDKECVGTVEWIVKDGGEHRAAIRLENGRLALIPVCYCSLKMAEYDKHFFDVNGNVISGEDVCI